MISIGSRALGTVLDIVEAIERKRSEVVERCLSTIVDHPIAGIVWDSM